MNNTEYQNDPRTISRLKILSQLEPYPNRTITDMDTLIKQNKISDTDLYLKYNFSIFIAEFENDNGNIVEFGSLLPFTDKIKLIKNQIYEYVRRQIEDQSSTSEGSETGGAV